MKRIVFAAMAIVLAACSNPRAVEIDVDGGKLVLSPLTDNSIRVRFVRPDAAQLEELFYVNKVKTPSYRVEDEDGTFSVIQEGITTRYDKTSGTISFYDAEGEPLLKEVSASEVNGRTFDSPSSERLFGLGQFQDGYLDVRGLTRRLTQVNTQISIPFVMSSRGFGLLWNNYGLTEFNPCENSVNLIPAETSGFADVNATTTHGNRRERRFFETFTAEIDIAEAGEYALLLDVGQTMARKHYLAVDDAVIVDVNNSWLPPTTSVKLPMEAGTHKIEVKGVHGDSPILSWRLADNTTTFRSPFAEGVDYTVFAGGADEVIGTYRHLTGEAPLMPSWLLGYVHCRERYDTQAELLENARTFKEKGIPVDVIVQDWQWWGKYGWNAMRFDEDKYPDPVAMVDSLHDMDIRLMLSVWSKVDRGSVLGKELEARGYYIEDTDWIDYFNPEAARFYWENFRDSLVSKGIDSWWFDATEPENDDLAGRYEEYRNVYPLKVISTIYDGLKAVKPSEEPVILTRSMAPGIQRYGAVCWSGDIGNDWETLRRQIAGGLSLCSCGLPWWTYDAGGFFRPWDQYEDADYQERMIRWIQTSVFLPVMRVHGYMSRTEPWRYPEDIEKLFVAAIRQRYELKPYVEECARMVAEDGYTIMRPLYFDFPSDSKATGISDEYMFGPKYLVCPVLSSGIDEIDVYLPIGRRWKDIRNGMVYEGGQSVKVAVDITAIPVFETI
ncbi:MAG: DUF4968 domain-containing protein [Bacteroidales bacterium]|nr:DUF4968 domain-containing protein [Bacteroidales bacterium]